MSKWDDAHLQDPTELADEFRDEMRAAGLSLVEAASVRAFLAKLGFALVELYDDLPEPDPGGHHRKLTLAIDFGRRLMTGAHAAACAVDDKGGN